jgi:hypothetical protein
MPFPFVPVVAGVGFVWGLWKLFAGGGGGSSPPADDKPPYEPPPPPADPVKPGEGWIKKTSPDNPEGTIADYNEFYNKGRSSVDQAIADEAGAIDAGVTGYCVGLFCLGNLNHLTPSKDAIKTNQGRRGFADGVEARIKELGLSVDEDGDLSH